MKKNNQKTKNKYKTKDQKKKKEKIRKDLVLILLDFKFTI